MTPQPQDRVADLAARYPATIRVFQHHGIDFCCGGKRPLEQAARESDVDWSALAEELEAATADRAGEPSEPDRPWAEAPLGELIDHIVDHYHGKLREELPRLLQMAEKVVSVHGPKHPRTEEALATLRRLAADLEMHTAKEEQVLFPLVGRLVETEAEGRLPEELRGGTIAMPILVMETEHDAAADALRRLRSLTDGFTPPEDACNTFRGLYHGLAELEADTHRHIHLENNILFPRAADLEKTLRGAPEPASAHS